MQSEKDIQVLLFQKITEQMPEHLSLVDEISDLLGISVDSAYRRIRGEKPISIYEVQKLCTKYGLSFDDIAHTSANTISFHSDFLDEASFSFNGFFESLYRNFQRIHQQENTEIIFILNELNLLQLMQIPEILTFKLFFWQKSNLGFPSFKDKVFSLDSVDDDLTEITKEISKLYVRTQTIELTTEEVLNSFLKQIVFYNDAGFFRSPVDARGLCDKLSELVTHLKQQAECGFKFRYGTKPAGREGNYMLYHNDIILADNTILVKSGNNEISFITGNAINLMYTYNKKFFDYNYVCYKNLVQKSTLISNVSENIRNRFFINLSEKIKHVRDKI